MHDSLKNAPFYPLISSPVLLVVRKPQTEEGPISNQQRGVVPMMLVTVKESCLQERWLASLAEYLKLPELNKKFK